MDSIKVLLASANYPNDYYMWGPWNKEANIAIANSKGIIAETIAPLPYSLPVKFFPYNQLSKIPSVENGPEGKIHHPKFLYLMPKKIFYGYEGSFYRKSVEKYSKNLQKPDIIHCHHVYPDGYGFIQLCKKWNVPLIVDIHSSRLLNEIKEKKPLVGQYLETLNFAKKIFCISHEIKDSAISIGIEKKKLEVIPLGIDIEKFKPRDKDLLKKKFGINNKYVILYVGHLVKMKGVNNLISAISELPESIKTDLKVLIIGEGNKKEYLMQLSQKFNLDDIIYFLGSINRDMIHYYYNIADIFVLPSLSEGRPVVIYEAMASECAIISTNLKGISEQVKEDYNGFLVEPRNTEVLANKIEYLLENQKTMEKMKKNSRLRIVAENWTWEGYSKNIIKTYREILGGII